MSERPRVLAATGSAVGLSALALAFGACCTAPWAVALLGVGGALLLARLAALQPYVVAVTLALLGVGTAQFPHLDLHVFAAKVHAMLNALTRTAPAP